MREVSVHLADEFVVFFKTVSEAFDIGCPEPEFACALNDIYPAGVLSYFLLYNPGGAVGRIIVDDKDIEWYRQCKNSVDDGGGVLTFVIHRYYYGSIAAGSGC